MSDPLLEDPESSCNFVSTLVLMERILHIPPVKRYAGSIRLRTYIPEKVFILPLYLLCNLIRF